MNNDILNQSIKPDVLMRISIIIPTFNRSETLKITLRSLINQNYPETLFEIIIVDNGSTDTTRDVVNEFIDLFPKYKIKYVYEGRQGVHYARNTGGKESSFELLYFTDDDVIADPNLLIEIIKPFYFDTKVACVTGRVLPTWVVPPPNWIKKHCYNSLLSILDIQEDFVISNHLNYIYSCHLAILKTVLFEVGGFNPENTRGEWIGDGETGLVIKIEACGYKFGFNGKSVTNHIIPASRMTQSYLNKRIGNSGNCYAFTYYRKNHPSSFGLIFEIFVLLIVKIPLKSIYFLFQSIYEKDLGYLRFIPAYIFYYFNRSRYNFRLATNRKLRSFVLRDNWFEDNSNDDSWPF